VIYGVDGVDMFVLQPELFLDSVFTGEHAAPALKFAHGTTTLGFVFKHGVGMCGL
jgi:hypothetical protein